MNQCVPVGPIPLEDVAELLREELRDCHRFVKLCFSWAAEEKAFFESRRDSMNLAARLMQANNSTVATLYRIAGNASRQEIVVTRNDERGEG